MCKNGIDLSCPILNEFVSCKADGATCICHIINKDGDAVLDVTHQCHACHLICLLALFVDEGKLNIQP